MGGYAMPLDKIIAYENGELDYTGIISLIQELVDTGLVWQLQGSYGRLARDLIERGEVTLNSKRGDTTSDSR
jgi:hypothetical protein